MPFGSKSSPPATWDANVHYKNRQIAEQYDGARFSSLAGRVFNTREKRLVVRAFAGLPRGARIADIPCGTGRLAEPLLEAGFRVHGMDISREMLDVASRRLARFGDAFTTEVADAKAMKRPEEPFAGVLCARVLMHFDLDEQIAFLRGVASLTSGIVVVNHSFSSPYQRFRRRVKKALGHAAPARCPVTDSEIERLLGEAGLVEIRRERMNPVISEAVYVVARPVG